MVNIKTSQTILFMHGMKNKFIGDFTVYSFETLAQSALGINSSGVVHRNHFYCYDNSPVKELLDEMVLLGYATVRNCCIGYLYKITYMYAATLGVKYDYTRFG